MFDHKYGPQHRYHSCNEKRGVTISFKNPIDLVDVIITIADHEANYDDISLFADGIEIARTPIPVNLSNHLTFGNYSLSAYGTELCCVLEIRWNSVGTCAIIEELQIFYKMIENKEIASPEIYREVEIENGKF